MESRCKDNRFHLKTVGLSRATTPRPCPLQMTKSAVLFNSSLWTQAAGIMVPVGQGTAQLGDTLGSSKPLSTTQSNQCYSALEKHLLAKVDFSI